MNMMKKDILVDLIKAAGEELFERAEDFVNDGVEPSEMDIWIRIRRDEPPEIECTSTYTSRKSYSVLMKHSIKE